MHQNWSDVWRRGRRSRSPSLVVSRLVWFQPLPGNGSDGLILPTCSSAGPTRIGTMTEISSISLSPTHGSAAMRAILDTSVLLATDLIELEGALAISVASLAELHFGVLVTADRAIRAERLRRLSALQRRFDALPIDDAVAVSYGQLAAAVLRTGRQPRSRVMDLLIAATAHAHSARLYTRNAADLVGIEQLIDIVAV